MEFWHETGTIWKVFSRATKNDLSKFCYDVIKGVKIEVKGQPNFQIFVLALNGYFSTTKPKKWKILLFFLVLEAKSPIALEKSVFKYKKCLIENLTFFGPSATKKIHVLGHNSGSGWNFSNLFTYLKTREKMQSHVCQQIFSI